MGMFDYVAYKAPCYHCGKELDCWQSKDHDCLLETVQPHQVRRFYASCQCGAWNEYKVEPPTELKIVPNHERGF